MSHDHEHNHEELIESEWLRIKEQRDALLSGKALESVTSRSFMKEKECACCIDERVANRETLGGEEVEGRWYVAGSGILLPVDSWMERAMVAAEEAHKRGVTRFSYHAGCGAAGLAVEKDKDQLQNYEECKKNPEIHAKAFAEAAQKELNKLSGLSENTIYVGKEEVAPNEFHNALGAVVDATGEFNAHTLSEGSPLRLCFNLDWSSAENLPENNYNLIEIKTAIEIALGHGFGHSRFDAEDPFSIVVVASDLEQFYKISNAISGFIDSDEKLSSLKETLKVVPLIKPEHKKPKATKLKLPAEVRA